MAGSRVRLRATLPPKPTDPPGSEAKQHRISTGLVYPDQASEALLLEEKLGNALVRHRVGLDLFDWSPWLSLGRKRGVSASQGGECTAVSGTGAIRQAHQWWLKQRHRGQSADESWKVDYQAPLSPLVGIEALSAEHLVALVETTETASRSSHRSRGRGTARSRERWSAGG